MIQESRDHPANNILTYSPGNGRSPPARRLNQMLGQGLREQAQGNVGVNLDYVISGIQEMQDR